MREHSNWSLSLGRWAGVQVRLHISLLVAGIFIIYFCSVPPDPPFAWYGPLAVLILTVSLLLHEFGHCYAALRVGGSVDQIVIGPLGGLAPINIPHEPQRELVVACAGPAVNLLIWMLIAPFMLITGENVLDLIKPIGAHLGGETVWLTTLKLTFWINWLLVVVNLLPAFPLDGARLLRCVLWQTFGFRTAVLMVVRFAQLTAVALLLAAWLMNNDTRAGVVPPWLPLTLLSMFIWFSAWNEVRRLEERESEDDLLGYDFSQGYTSLERATEPSRRAEPNSMRRWLQNRRAAKQRRMQEVEQQEEQSVDEILARLHASGLKGISAAERALLERVSARYRNRMRS